jgi:diguanylate cyclase (GGDEF)-like protein
MYPLLVVLLLQARWLVPESGVVPLDGPWRLHAGDAAAYARLSYEDSSWQTVMVPGPWKSYGHPAPRGFVWYRGRFVLEHLPAAQLGLEVQARGMAFEVYVDGQRLGGVGEFPPDYRARTQIPAVFAIPVSSLSPRQHLIAIRAYSLEANPVLGGVALEPVSRLLATNRHSDLYMLAVAVLFIGLAVNQLFFWARRREAREHLYMFLFCAGLALYFVNWMPSVHVALAPVSDWFRLFVALGAASVAALALGTVGIFEIEPESRTAQIARAFGLGFAVLVLLALLLPTWTMVRWVEGYLYDPAVLIAGVALIRLARATQRRDVRSATILMWGSWALVLTAFHDLALSWGLLPHWGGSTIVVQYGAVAFVLAGALATADKFADTQVTALYDRLTGLYRREVVMDALAREIRRTSSRVQQPISVIMMDLDHFKAVNDSVGHQAGDRVLAEVGRRLAEAGRAVDWLGRYGGEEFIAVLAATPAAGAVQTAERFRSAVGALPFEVGRAARLITLSAGVAAYDGGEDWITAEQLVGAADAALYRAKNAGRNRTSE